MKAYLFLAQEFVQDPQEMCEAVALASSVCFLSVNEVLSSYHRHSQFLHQEMSAEQNVFAKWIENQGPIEIHSVEFIKHSASVYEPNIPPHCYRSIKNKNKYYGLLLLPSIELIYANDCFQQLKEKSSLLFDIKSVGRY